MNILVFESIELVGRGGKEFEMNLVYMLASSRDCKSVREI